MLYCQSFLCQLSQLSDSDVFQSQSLLIQIDVGRDILKLYIYIWLFHGVIQSCRYFVTH